MKYKILVFLLVIFSIIKNINALSIEVNDKSSFYDSLSNGVDIILTKDIYLDKEYLNVEEQYFLVNSTNNITIDLNGYNIYGLSLFIVETNLNIINTSTNNSLITGLNDSEIVALMFGNLYINNVTLQYVNTNDNNYM